ncbi:hypothetical protein [Pseudaminobacter soli (ex Li et al. 2025)]|nr:hypothetical protein [Mesorhizobium soli]
MVMQFEERDEPKEGAVDVGTITFEIHGFNPIAWASLPMTLQGYLALDPGPGPAIRLRFLRIETALERLHLAARVDGGVIERGSIRFKDGKLIIEVNSFIGAILALVPLIMGYPDLRQGIIELTKDISAAIEGLQGLDVNFAPLDPDSIAREIIPALPLDIRRRVENPPGRGKVQIEN